ncbi:hypothetical protein SCMU_28720 [Sinomonas cyclohexanicum]|uniref:HTH tetR-type domain-containing protein n=1 Tax=Sinomonas cyclohexanicum TaxID=322009 RepID=A0ABM7PXM3_SINCY|nr:TetR/AcrR family transcriptional regulator [Corynebacterium cyclohexanicum]BCT77030.1 hypothetical protein SCMU_28720 [Corynebacterium cyclohexanicum]
MPTPRGSATHWGEHSPGRRLPAAETRERLLSAAVRMLRATGLTVSLEHLSMEELIREADVPRSSVFRIWGSKANFFSDLLLELIRPESAFSSGYDLEADAQIMALVQRHQHLLATPEGRRAVLEEVVRVGIELYSDRVFGSQTFRFHAALGAALPTIPEPQRSRVEAALADAESTYVAHLAGLYEAIMPAVHLRPKEGLTTTDVAAAGSALVQGLAERRRMLPELAGHTLMRPGIGGEPVAWTLGAIAFLAIVDGMAETT